MSSHISLEENAMRETTKFAGQIYPMGRRVRQYCIHIKYIFVKVDPHLYGSRLSHFIDKPSISNDKPSISNDKPSISNDKPSISNKNLEYQTINLVYQIEIN